MQNYLFFLGRDNILSKLELLSYLDVNNIKYKIIKDFNDVLLIDIEELDFTKIINELGGITKIAKIIKLEEFDPCSLLKNYNKISYGISFYTKKHLDLLDFIKNKFKEEAIKIFY